MPLYIFRRTIGGSIINHYNFHGKYADFTGERFQAMGEKIPSIPAHDNY
jgi:hypothetical protein